MSTNISANPSPGLIDSALAQPHATRATDALLDDPQEWETFGRLCADAARQAPPGAWESHVVIGGMHCAACALTIEDALRAVPGVARADVSAATQRAR
ncbi:MAG: heavy metal-associated domain-containing protein, partial [Simplicispira sp.]|nr:heavy metal-associated domain-containing protein [Simplicispira sp.]